MFYVIFTAMFQTGVHGLDDVRTVFRVPTNEILKGVTPFVVGLLIHLVLIVVFPEITLWLPNLMINN